MKKYLVPIILSMVLAGFIFAPGATAQTEDEPVVHAVLFFSPTCPHCHDVIDKLLIPMVEEHGERLQILAVDVSQDSGQMMYQTAIEHYQIPPNRLGVPTMIINDKVLVGSGEIPDQFPQMVADGLAGSGIGWPGIPGLAESLAAQAQAESPPAEEAAAETSTEAAPETTVSSESNQTDASGGSVAAEPVAEAPPADAETNEPAAAAPQPDTAVVTLDENNVPEVATAEAAPPPDPIGISLAGLVLGGMLFALYYAARVLSRSSDRLFELSRYAAGPARGWLIPLLALLGLAVSAYLAYVEITHTEAVCGPVGNCNEVQSSPYAVIAGVPVAVLGLLNYVAVIALWLGLRFGRGQVADLSILGLLALGLVGVIFSVYLTALEIFVIQAVCAWCISSAIITTAILLITAASIHAPSSRRRAAVA